MHFQTFHHWILRTVVVVFLIIVVKEKGLTLHLFANHVLLIIVASTTAITLPLLTAGKKRKTVPHAINMGINEDHLCTDDEEEKLMAGYGVKRGPRGALIPLSRPDLDARKLLERNNEDVLIGRSRKNRKNKKKQSRDEAMTDFARNNSR
mmetsp:Transcript_20945/g.30364  ORF Transcript_20945/g.30364 Transcript_20945/m.30364 type:complete len:150 (+) Transcript_20945:1162-1611(+)